jgi:hypothetical protein
VKKLLPLGLFLSALITFGVSVANVQAAEPTAVGSVGIRIAQIPAEVANHPYSKAYIVSRIYPGVALTQRLEVFNTSSQEFKVDLYAGKATFQSGNFEVADGRTGNDLTSWTKISPNVLVVKPGQHQYFNITILPPTDAPSIQQFGVIWAEVQGAKNITGISAVSRVGIRMYVPVGDSAAIPIGGSSMTSSTNEIVVKKTLLTSNVTQLILFLIFLSIVSLAYSVFFSRRGKSDRQFRKENEKRLESQWKRERNRRREIWKRRNQSHNQREPRYIDDEHYEEHR